LRSSVEELDERLLAVVRVEADGYVTVEDLDSVNGTYLNGRRVSQPCRLTDKDQITVADYAFTFRQPQRQKPPAKESTIGAEKTIQEIKSLNCWLLVADIEGSTQFTQRLAADEAPRVTGRWLAECKQIVDDHSGTINKFLGDGFFAYWLERENTVASVAKSLVVLQQVQKKEHPRFRLVLHYGKVFVGGAASMGEESLLGNEVNFVFRMEKLAGSLGAPRLMSAAASEKIKSLCPPQAESRHKLAGFDGEFTFCTF
jgi:class 3 adenylate cyclase